MKLTNFKYYFLLSSLYIFVFQELLEKYFSVIKYYDEIFALLIIPVFFFIFGKNLSEGKIKINKVYFKIIILFTILIVVGLYSSFRFKYQPLNMVFSDLLIIIKFPLVIFFSNLIFKEFELEKWRKKILLHIKIILILLFLLSMLNYQFKIFEVSYRYGLIANKLFYSHPAKLLSICVFLLSLFVFLEKRLFSKWIIALFLLMLSTLRAKAFGFCLVSVVLFLMFNKSKRKLNFIKICFMGIACVILVFDQISIYFLENTGTARFQLLEKAFFISNDYFPFGTGFATFGSYHSAVIYSPIYNMYGISNVYGLAKQAPIFISDSFWPMILGQFGYIGFICYLYFVWILYKSIQRINFNESKYLYISKLLCLIYLLISSVSESSFVNPMAIPLALIIGIKIDGKGNDIYVK